MFTKILIANRGEIAVRIIRSCKRLNIGSVAVFSDADARSPYVRDADEAAFIGPAPATDSYLVKEKIIDTALRCGCQAIHPGYGFLSENPEFARMVQEAGLVFIGPAPDAIALLGDKMASKQLARNEGVPVVPGHDEPLGNPDEAMTLAGAIGFPLLLKPAAGGGGRGMRIVTSKEELLPALEACQEETRKSFADTRVFIERYVSRPRHIEFQIMADNFGSVIHLGERECSIQRRYQKVIEETPSVVIDSELRQRIGQVACDLARAAGYTNAGTVEFILDSEKNFYFLEMNTRLQVEHPVTEEVTKLDLVELQLRVAAGERLPLGQSDVIFRGWAIEARICAEDPSRGFFFPTTGIVTRYAPPRGRNIRVDSGIDAGSVITVHYDSLLAKVISYGDNREEARQGLVRALNGYHIEGLITNVDFVNALADHPAFAQGDLSTNFIDEHFFGGKSQRTVDPEKIDYMIMAAVLVYHVRRSLIKDSIKPMTPRVGVTPVQRRPAQYVVKADEGVFKVTLDGNAETRLWTIQIDDRAYRVQTPDFEFYRRRLALRINGTSHMFRLQYRENHIQAFFCGIIRMFEIYSPLEWELCSHMLRDETETVENILRCPMPGLITAVKVKPGDLVRKGQDLLRIESMKMESAIASPCDGKVLDVLVSPAQAVEADDTLVTFEL